MRRFIKRFVGAYRELYSAEIKMNPASPAAGVYTLSDITKQMKSTKKYVEKVLNKIPLSDFEKAGYKVSFGKPMGAGRGIFKIRNESYKTVYIKRC